MAKQRNKSKTYEDLLAHRNLYIPPFSKYTLEYRHKSITVITDHLEQMCFVVFANLNELEDPDTIIFPNGTRYRWGEKGTLLANYYCIKKIITHDEFLNDLEIIPHQSGEPQTKNGLYHLVFDFTNNLLETVNCALEISNASSITPSRILLPSGESVCWDNNSAVRLIKGLCTPLKFVIENLEQDE